jgi:hypothetical protein
MHIPTYEVIELDVEHIVLTPMHSSLDDLIARIADQGARINAFAAQVA